MGAHVVEAIKPQIDNMGQQVWQRLLYGPFDTFDEAHHWMTTIGNKAFPTLIIHSLQKPLDPHNAAVLGDIIREAKEREPEEPE